jgi:hypothetical protein
MSDSRDEVKQRVGDNFNELRAGLDERTRELRQAIGDYVDAHPLSAVGIAFGIGYLLSGALFSRATFRAVALGGRFALGGLVKQLVAGIGPGMILAAVTGRGGAVEAPARTEGSGNGNRSQQQ